MAGIFKFLGKLSEQQVSLIEERLKAAASRMGKAGLRPGHRAEDTTQVSAPAAASMHAGRLVNTRVPLTVGWVGRAPPLLSACMQAGS